MKNELSLKYDAADITNRLRSLNGDVIAPTDIRYDKLRRGFFTGFDRKPALIVRASNTADVARVVTVARDAGAELAIRSGGHSRAGDSTSEGGILLDLEAMDRVEIAQDRSAAWAETGIKAGAYTMVTGQHGLATGLGDTASVGLGGIALAGGMGFLVRKHGMTIDDLLAAEVVTADGKILQVDELNHPDLFWALRGGGGNFGVVTRVRLRLHEIDDVVGGILVLPAKAEVISGLVAAAEEASDDLSVIAKVMKAPPSPFIPQEQHGKLVVMARMVYAGNSIAANEAIAPIRALATPIADLVRPVRYPEMYAGPEAPGPAFSVGTNLLLEGLSIGDAEAILVQLQTATAAIPVVEVRSLGGAMGRVRDGATAFAHRRAKLMVNTSAMDHDAERIGEHEAWAACLTDILSGGATIPAYIGFIGTGVRDELHRAYPPATLRVLAQVKRKYDPDNLFHLNLNVAPKSA